MSSNADPTIMTSWEEVARFLWDLLDDIDTLDDVCKSNDVWFRNAVRVRQLRRFEVSSSDGYEVVFNLKENKERSDEKEEYGDG